jgi:heme exporter protein D
MKRGQRIALAVVGVAAAIGLLLNAWTPWGEFFRHCGAAQLIWPDVAKRALVVVILIVQVVLALSALRGAWRLVRTPWTRRHLIVIAAALAALVVVTVVDPAYQLARHDPFTFSCGDDGATLAR